jgi:acetyl esterase/lipase
MLIRICRRCGLTAPSLQHKRLCAGRKIPCVKTYRILTLALLAAAASAAFAQVATLPLWPNGAPETVTMPGPEQDIVKPTDRLVDGRKFIHLANVSQPALAVYKAAAAKDSGAAVLVFPGGGYRFLAYDLEGTEVCDWLNSIGVTCVLVKYRVPINNADGKTQGHFPERTEDLEDAQQAMRITRAHAAAWKIDPNRVGVLGFSAGGHLAAVISNHADFRYKGESDADAAINTQPDFTILIYPAYLTDATLTKLAPEVVPTANTPPTFLVQAEDDPVHEENVLLYFEGLKLAKVPAELHIFAQGAHGYGLRPGPLPITHWPEFAATWMHTIKVLPAQ